MDTHHRYVQYTVTKQLQKDTIPNLAPHAFTVASADNLDCNQPHATVYSGDQSRSWHGTTMFSQSHTHCRTSATSKLLTMTTLSPVAILQLDRSVNYQEQMVGHCRRSADEHAH